MVHGTKSARQVPGGTPQDTPSMRTKHARMSAWGLLNFGICCHHFFSGPLLMLYHSVPVDVPSPPPHCVKSNLQSSGYISILATHLARTRPGFWRETPVCPYQSASRRHLFPTYSHQRAVPHQLPSRHPDVGTDSLGPVPTATSTASPKRQIAEPTVDLASSADPTHTTFGLPKDTQPRFTFKPHYPQVIDRPAVWNPAHSHLLPEHIEISIYNNTPTPVFLGRVSPDLFKKIPSRCSLYTPKILSPTLATTCPIAPWQLPLFTQTTHPPWCLSPWVAPCNHHQHPNKTTWSWIPPPTMPPPLLRPTDRSPTRRKPTRHNTPRQPPSHRQPTTTT